MDVAIVYESMFGNTLAVAEAIADGVHQADGAAHVALLPVAQVKADQVERADLLIVGGPTHLWGMSSPVTRRKGRQAGEKTAGGAGRRIAGKGGANGPGIRDWFAMLPPAPGPRRAAAFDTRAGLKLAGGAARAIARRLRRLGYRLAAKPEGFIVEGSQGPLRAGERDRARAWGAALVREPGPRGAG